MFALEDTDILFGKIALGRRYISRADALRLAEEVQTSANAGRKETVSAAAVRLGYLAPKQAEELQQVLRHGSLICRGSCGQLIRLSSLRPQQTLSCQSCQGHLYVAGVEAAMAANLPEEEGGQGGQTLLELDAGDVPAPPGDAGGDPDDPLGGEAGTTFLDLDLDMPSPGGGDTGAPPPPTTQAPTTSPPPLPIDMPTPVLVTPPGQPQFGPDDGTTLGRSDPEYQMLIASAEKTAEMNGPGGFLGGGEKTAEMDLPGATWRGTPPGMEFEPFRIGDDLEILAPIGRGGMGSVYRGRRRRDGKVVAIKILAQNAAILPDVVARFRREISLTSKLKHPHIVQVYDSGIVPEDGGENAGRPYFTMDYVAGRDLAAWVEEGTRTQAEIVRILLPVCDAMNYAHGRGVIHRDLKPANVLVSSSNDHVWVCDFGLAKYRSEAQSLTRTGDILGTPSYMPPEQALGNRTKIGPPTDVYALGAILYYLLTQRPPFSGPSSFAVIDKVVRAAPEPPSTFRADISPELERVILKTLAKEPIERYHTCAQLSEALSAFSLS